MSNSSEIWAPNFVAATASGGTAPTSVTYSIKVGRSYHVGPMWFIQGCIYVQSISGGSGAVAIGPLPANVIASRQGFANEGRASGVVSTAENFGASAPFALEFIDGQNYFIFRKRGSSGVGNTSAIAGTTYLQYSDLAAGPNADLLEFSGSFLMDYPGDATDVRHQQKILQGDAALPIEQYIPFIVPPAPPNLIPDTYYNNTATPPIPQVYLHVCRSKVFKNLQAGDVVRAVWQQEGTWDDPTPLVVPTLPSGSVSVMNPIEWTQMLMLRPVTTLGSFSLPNAGPTINPYCMSENRGFNITFSMHHAIQITRGKVKIGDLVNGIYVQPGIDYVVDGLAYACTGRATPVANSGVVLSDGQLEAWVER